MLAAIADNLNAEITMQGETPESPASAGRTANAIAPTCEKCGGSLAFVGELPAIRLLPLLQVYRCKPCNDVVTVAPP